MVANKRTRERSLLSRAEAAEVLGVSLPTLNRWFRAGYVRSLKLGGRRLVPVEEIDRLKGGAQ